jgi:hypothetical protein
MELKNLIDDRLDLERLAKDLDELGHPARLWAIRSWGKETQAKLYEAAKGFHKLTLDDYVPPRTAPLVEVIHHGRNSLPVQNFFQKHFCKPKDPEAKGVLWGFNYQSLLMFSGPGYFVTHQAADEGEVDIDYTMLPKEKPDAWPPIIPNTAGIARFVYAGMIDVMRGISTHVSIGRAKRGGKLADHWFVLVREDPLPAA